MNTTTCPSCGISYGVGCSWLCKDGHERWNSAPVADVTYPGGLVLTNGFPAPVTVYSESERKALLKEHGLREAVYHIPAPGSDASPVTRSWDVPCAQTLENARILVSRQATVSDPDAGRLDTLRVGFEFNPVKAYVKA